MITEDDSYVDNNEERTPDHKAWDERLSTAVPEPVPLEEEELERTLAFVQDWPTHVDALSNRDDNLDDKQFWNDESLKG